MQNQKTLFLVIVLLSHFLIQPEKVVLSSTSSGQSVGRHVLSYPPDPTSDISWSVGVNGVTDIQSAFNSARSNENIQLGTSIPMLTLPSQSAWDNMTDGERALWLINRERIDRGIMPLDNIEVNITGIAQHYADYLLDNNLWGHYEDGYSPWERLNNNPAIGTCHDFLSVAENLTVFVTTAENIKLPIERSIFMWLYTDKGSSWGHRHAILWYPFNDNSGIGGKEGFLGIGRSNGGPYQGPFSQPWPYAEIIVMNVFDPCSTWAYPMPHVSGVTRADTNPTTASNVGFAVMFSEPVTGVDTNVPFSDFALHTTGSISGAAVTRVVDSGDQTSYTVTVDTGSGDGTLRLDVGDNGSIADLSGNPLDGGFTGGEAYTILKSAAFGKTAPTDGATGQSLSPTLSWEDSFGATSYEYCYSSAPGPCSAWRSVGNNTSVNLSGLAAGYTYYWQVRAVNEAGPTEADDGAWWSFTTQTTTACTWPAYTAPTLATFADVPMSAGHWSWVERLSNSGITAGCGNGNYCPFDEVVRAQMAIFLLRGKHCGSSYTPPAVGGSTGFNDVPLSASYAPWVKQLAAEGITSGCGGGNFCPGTVVNRAQMAIFLLRAKHGSTYSAPGVRGSSGFNDVPANASYAPWVKQLAAEGITAGCGGGNFCPLQAVNRAQMATFLVRAFGLP